MGCGAGVRVLGLSQASPTRFSFSRHMKILSTLILTVALGLIFSSSGRAADAPKVLGDYLEADVNTRAEAVAIIPPKEIEKYLLKVREAVEADPEWALEFRKSSSPGKPLPYDEKMGLTKEEYADYLVLWAKRDMAPLPDGEVTLKLESPKEGEWVIRATGMGVPVSLIRYDVKSDVMNSPNGKMTRLPDIDADEQSVMGAWTGHEWKFEEEGILGRTKENLAIGKTKEGNFGLLVYRLQEVSTEGQPVYDRRILIRFPLAAK